jgi:hypothetical protein
LIEGIHSPFSFVQNLDVVRLKRGLDKSLFLWYNLYVRMREAERQTDQILAIPTAARLTTPIQMQARANRGGEQGWGVAVGILSIEDCERRGNL